MKPVEIVKQGKETVFVDKKGGHSTLKLLPPMNEADLAKLETEIGCGLPHEMRELMQYCSGFELPEYQFRGSQACLQSVLFAGHDIFSSEDIFPHGFAVGSDDNGNFWVVDLRTDNPEDTAVFYACHDPPVILHQAHTLGEFIEQVLALSDPSAAGALNQVHDEYSKQVWTTNPGVLTRQEALAADAEMRAFAESLDDTYLFVDLRNASLGQGFSWGRYGADTVIKRAGEKRIFAYQKKELNWFQKLFGV